MNAADFAAPPASACTQGTSGADRITRKVYDAAGQLLQIREGVGTGIEAAEATFAYTANGKREYVIDANGNRAQLSFAALLRIGIGMMGKMLLSQKAKEGPSGPLFVPGSPLQDTDHETSPNHIAIFIRCKDPYWGKYIHSPGRGRDRCYKRSRSWACVDHMRLGKC